MGTQSTSIANLPGSFGVDDEFGEGGIGLSGSASEIVTTPPGGNPTRLRDYIRTLLGSIWTPYANVAALELANMNNVADGQLTITLDTYTIWVWEKSSTASPDAAHVQVTGVTTGRWVDEAAAPGIPTGQAQGEIQHLHIDIPLTTIQAEVSGTAFNIGAALPANARLVATELLVVVALSGGSAASAHATIQNTGETAGAILASESVFTGAASTPIGSPGVGVGSNPYVSRGGQQLQMTITGDGTHALSTLTAGHLEVDLFYAVVP
jgi:hypothetical protein